jgi:glycosyltransferase involved in cell wall biosynthesis
VELVYLGAPDIVAALDSENRCLAIPYRARAKVDLTSVQLVRRTIQQERPDAIHAFAGRPLANVILATMGISPTPPIVSFRGIERVPSLLDPSELIAYKHARVAAHACESNAVLEAMVRGGVPRERCTTIYNCVPAQPPAVTKEHARQRLAQWNIPEGAFVVGTIAAIRPVKGIDLLLRAAIECSDLLDAYWVLIGPVRDRCVERLAQDPAIRARVRLLGLRTDASELVRGFDVFAMPSRTEGLCRALLEAMSQEVCAVVSDAGGMKEVVRHGREGLVVPRENAAALGRALRLLYDNRDLTGGMAAAARRRIADAFTPVHMVQRALDLYRRVLGPTAITRRVA